MQIYKSLKTGKFYRVNGGRVEYKINGSWYGSVTYGANTLEDTTKFVEVDG